MNTKKLMTFILVLNTFFVNVQSRGTLWDLRISPEAVVPSREKKGRTDFEGSFIKQILIEFRFYSKHPPRGKCPYSHGGYVFFQGN